MIPSGSGCGREAGAAGGATARAGNRPSAERPPHPRPCKRSARTPRELAARHQRAERAKARRAQTARMARRNNGRREAKRPEAAPGV